MSFQKLFSFQFISFFLSLSIFATCAVAEDTAAPQVTSLAFSPTTINTEAADQLVTLTVTLTDDLVGVCISGDCGSFFYSSPTQLLIQSPDGSQSIGFVDFQRQSGTSTHGIYTASITVPKGSMKGIWEVDSFLLVDQLGNMVSRDKVSLAAEFGTSAIEITNTAAVDDTSPPEVTSLAITPVEINTESAEQVLTLTVSLTDDLVGVCISTDCGSFNNGSPSQLLIQSPNGLQSQGFVDLQRISGDSINGTYTASITLPKGSEKGVWEVVSFLLSDQLGNMVELDKASLASEFGLSATEITNTATLDDTAPPEVTAFDISPATINTQSTDQTLTLTLTLTDDLAGVCTSADCGSFFYGSPTQLGIKPLIGTQSTGFWDLTRESGDALSGIYTSTITIPAHAKEGIWQVQELLLVDQLGNMKTLSVSDLNEKFGGRSLTIANTAEATSVSIEDTWIFTSDAATVTFTPDTIVTRELSENFAFYEMVNQGVETVDIPIDLPDGEMVKAIKFGIPDIGLNFSKPVQITLAVGAEFEGSTLRVVSLNEGDNGWNEESECAVFNGECSFSVSHASYFSALSPPVQAGDVNNSNSIDLADTVLALQIASGGVASEPIFSGSDVNNDGHVGIPEAIYSISYLAGYWTPSLTGSWNAYYSFDGINEDGPDTWGLVYDEVENKLTMCVSDKVFQGVLNDDTFSLDAGNFTIDGTLQGGYRIEGTFSSGGTWRMSKSGDETTCEDIEPWDIAINGLPEFVDNHHIDLASIWRISRFRSAVGHSYTDDYESCRSMKHYFEPRPEPEVDWSSLQVRALVSGTILDIVEESTPLSGKMVLLRSSQYPAFTFKIFHVNVSPVLNIGDSVVAGQLLGTHIGNTTNNDIAVSVFSTEGNQIISMFSVMTDSLFQDYIDLGIGSKNDFIITKEERDSEPISCEGETFTSTGGTIENYVTF